jgi:ubiquinone/menaquinone biosynthesis C-methylase UbiE
MDEQIKCLESCWTRSVEHGEKPSDVSLRDHLLNVHRADTGFTETCAQQCRDSDGRNTYDILADLIDPRRDEVVLDLGCGSGPLTGLCHKRYGQQLELIGVDMSPDELVLARRRVPDRNVRFQQALAQDLSFIQTNSLDVVLCHWALTLMDPVDPVLDELNRTIARGGLLGAITDGEMTSAPGYAEIHCLIYDFVQREYPSYASFELGDPRVRSSTELIKVVAAAFESAAIEVRPVLLTWQASASVLASEVARFFYATHVLSLPLRIELFHELRAFFDAQSPGEQACFSMPVNMLLVRKSE